MKNKIILFSTVCATLLCADTIKSIEYINLNKVSPQIMNETLNLKVGDELNSEQINEAVKKFYSYGYFNDISVDDTNGNLKFNFDEKPSIANIEIKGYKSRKEDIDAIKKMIKLDKGSLYSEAKVEEAKNKIKDMLSQEGYINSVVETEIETLNKDSVSLVFNVNKGDEIIIEEANYYGAKALDQSDFDKVTANKEIEIFPWFIGQNDGEVKDEQLKYDGKRINDLYYEKGYLDAKVKDPYLDIDFASKQAKLDFFITEGKKYTTNDIKIYVDESIIKAKDLYSELNLEVGDTFNIKKLRKDKEYIRTQIADKGYAFADVKFDIKKNEKDAKVDVIFNVIPGKKVYINDVKISGNTRTLDRVIRRHVYLAPGDLYNLTDFIDSKNKLQRTGYFDNVKMEGKRVSDDKIDIIVKVTEAATGSLIIGGGYSSYDKMMFNASVSDRNIFGSGMTASLSTELSANDNDFTLKLVNPAIFDSKYQASIEAYSKESEISRTYYDQDKDTKGFTASLGREVVRNLYAGVKYKLDFIKERYEYDDDFTYDSSKGNKYEDTDYVTSSLIPYLSFDNTDNYYNPRHGWKLGTSLEYAGVGGDSKYLKSSSYAKYFYSLQDWTDLDWILRLKTQLKILVDNGQLNQGDSLYLGGARTLRGFDSYAFPQNDSGYVVNPYKKLSASSIEMSFPLLPSAKMRWALFYDYGMIGEDSFNEIQRSSTGAVLEWISPFGPLQLIFAKPLDAKSDDDTSSFEFSLGTSF